MHNIQDSTTKQSFKKSIMIQKIFHGNKHAFEDAHDAGDVWTGPEDETRSVYDTQTKKASDTKRNRREGKESWDVKDSKKFLGGLAEIGDFDARPDWFIEAPPRTKKQRSALKDTWPSKRVSEFTAMAYTPPPPPSPHSHPLH